jgi:hypothetical protein
MALKLAGVGDAHAPFKRHQLIIKTERAATRNIN